MSDVAVTGVALKRISWGAIIAGAILALVVQVMLGLLGVGIGLASIDPTGTDGASGTTLLSAGGIYTALSILISIFVGAYAAARFAGSAVRRDAALHGVTTWAVTTLVAVYLLSSGASALVSGTFGAIGGTISSLGSAASSVVPGSLDALPDGLQADAEALLDQGEQQVDAAADQAQQQVQATAQDARAAAGTEDLGDAVSTIVSGLGQDAAPQERQAAVSLIAQRAGISEAEADQRLTQFQGQYDTAVAQARETAATAATAASSAAFGAFVVLLLGAIVGALGGVAGRPARFSNLYRD